jgi:hypothetical protein
MTHPKFSDFTLNFNPGARANDKAPTLKGRAKVLHGSASCEYDVAAWGPHKASTGEPDYYNVTLTPRDSALAARQIKTELGAVRNQPEGFELKQLGSGRLFERADEELNAAAAYGSNAAIIANSTLASSTVVFCCAYASPSPAMHAHRAAIIPRFFLTLMQHFPSSPLHAGNADPAAFCLLDEIAHEGNGDVRAKLDLRQSHLPEAIIDAMLHGHDMCSGDAIRGPLADDPSCLRRLGKERQRLQANPLAAVAVASRTGKIHGTAATKEQRFPQRQCLPLFRLIECGSEYLSVGARGDIGGNRSEVLDRRTGSGVRRVISFVRSKPCSFSMQHRIRASTSMTRSASTKYRGSLAKAPSTLPGPRPRSQPSSDTLFGPPGVFHNASPLSTSNMPGLDQGSAFIIDR